MLQFKDRLMTNEQLGVNEEIVSPNGDYKFRYQDDGNLVLYQGERVPANAKWSIEKIAKLPKKPGNCRMQEDGNLVCHDSEGTPYWASGVYEKFKNLHPTLIVQDDGNVVVIKPVPIWDTEHHPQK